MFCHKCGVQQPADANFCIDCGARLAARTAQPPRASPPPSAPASQALSAQVRVLDAGDKILFSGGDRSAVEKALSKYLRRGSTLVSPVGQVGSSWVAACGIPTQSVDLDDTQTLKLADVAKPGAATVPERPTDGCREEALGLKLIIYGPSVRAVQMRLAYLKQFGGSPVGDIELQNEEWVVVCDMSDGANTGYRW